VNLVDTSLLIVIHYCYIILVMKATEIKETEMTKQEARRIAIGTARSYLRSMGFTTNEMTIESAFAALDDLTRSEPELIASEWYAAASNNQLATFKREWRQWQQRGF